MRYQEGIHRTYQDPSPLLAVLSDLNAARLQAGLELVSDLPFSSAQGEDGLVRECLQQRQHLTHISTRSRRRSEFLFLLPQAGAPPLRLLCAIYEALSDPTALDDSGVAAAAAAAARALRARGYDLGESGRFPGLYKLLAHDDVAVRAEVRRTSFAFARHH